MTFLCLGIPDVNMPGVNAIKPHKIIDTANQT